MSRATTRRWVPRKQAAKIAGVNVSTINEWKNSGFIPPEATRSVGVRCFRYDRTFLEAQRQTPAAAPAPQGGVA